MPYTENEINKIFEDAKKIATDLNCKTLSHVIAKLPCARQSFYTWFPRQSEKHTEIKEILFRNKVLFCEEVKEQMFIEGSATCLIALLKLYGTEEDRRRLNNDKKDKFSENENRIVVNVTPEEAREIVNQLQNEY